MTNPKLSPAAQAVKTAAIDAYWLFHPGQAAAILRAAGDHVYHDWSGFNCVDHLCEIADELEALPDD